MQRKGNGWLICPSNAAPGRLRPALLMREGALRSVGAGLLYSTQLDGECGGWAPAVVNVVAPEKQSLYDVTQASSLAPAVPALAQWTVSHEP